MFPQTPHIECVALLDDAQARPRERPDAPRLRRRRRARPRGRAAARGRCEELGYDSMWSNDHPGAKGLETLAEFAEAAPAIELGVAVIALDRTPAEQIAAEIERARPRPRPALDRRRRRLLARSR